MLQSKNPSLAEFALRKMLSKEVFTDLHIETGQPVMLRRASCDWAQALSHDTQKPVIFTAPDIQSFLSLCFGGIETPRGQNESKAAWEVEMEQRGALHPATTLSGIFGEDPGTLQSCRVRVTAQYQSMMDTIAVVLRPLKDPPRKLELLGLPMQLSALLKSASSGLIVVTGPTGAGKSTTLAAMISEINDSKRANILTIEDPIEFLHERKLSLINQRELGVDVASFEVGVKDALRFVPDVILIGEIRDAATMRAALRAAESGHLVLTSLHAPTTFSAIRKMVSYIGDSQADVQAMAGCLVGLVAQALIPGTNEKNHLAYEFLAAREPALVAAISASGSDSSGSKLSELESQLREGNLKYGIPMVASVRQLVKGNHVSMARASAALVDVTDKQAVMKIATTQ